MAERRSPSVEHEIEQLRRDYIRRLPEKLAILRDRADAARAGRERGQIDALHRLAHSLKGTTGSYRLDDIAREMCVAEEACERLLRERSDPRAWRELGDALTRAQALASDRSPPEGS